MVWHSTVLRAEYCDLPARVIRFALVRWRTIGTCGVDGCCAVPTAEEVEERSFRTCRDEPLRGGGRVSVVQYCWSSYSATFRMLSPRSHVDVDVEEKVWIAVDSEGELLVQVLMIWVCSSSSGGWW